MPSDFGQLNARKAVVTGASSGIGRAIALELAHAGADLLIHCRSSLSLAEETADEVRRIGQSAMVLAADFANLEQLNKFPETVWKEFGPVDIWVNNAGADLLTGESAQASYSEKLQTLFDVDVRSTLQLSREVGTRMSAANGGTIINIGWDQADRGMEGESGELFAASKNAIMGFTRSLAVSLAPTVRVNCIAPGWSQTKWGGQASEHWQQRVIRETPLNRWGTPEDIARVARFLASSDAAYITGQVINVNGGAVR